MFRRALQGAPVPPAFWRDSTNGVIAGFAAIHPLLLGRVGGDSLLLGDSVGQSYACLVRRLDS